MEHNIPNVSIEWLPRTMEISDAKRRVKLADADWLGLGKG